MGSGTLEKVAWRGVRAGGGIAGIKGIEGGREDSDLCHCQTETVWVLSLRPRLAYRRPWHLYPRGFLRSASVDLEVIVYHPFLGGPDKPLNARGCSKRLSTVEIAI